MKIDTNVGELSLEGLCITPWTTKTDFFELFSGQYHAYVINGSYESYNVQDLENGEFSFIIYFNKEKLHSINIGLGQKYNFKPFEITDEESDAVKKILYSLGGDKKYPWGEVIYSEDPKGGITGIIVKYN